MQNISRIKRGRLKACLFSFIAASVASVLSAEPATSQIDREIRFWESRLSRDAEDDVSRVKLANALLQKAREAGVIKNFEKAETLLREILKRNDKNDAARVSLASACIARHKFAEALELALKSVESRPDDAYARGVLGDVYFALGQIEKAENEYKKLAELNPGFAVLTRTSGIQQIKGDITGAIESLKQALNDGEECNAPAAMLAWCHIQIGALYFSKGDLNKTAESYAAAQKLSPESVSVVERTAELLGAQGKIEEALKLYEKLQKESENPHLWQSIGDLHALLKNKDEAVKWHQRVLDACLQDAQNGGAHYYRQIALLYCDIIPNPVEALKWAQKDLELRQDIWTYETLAWAQYRNSDFAAAAENIKRALALGTQEAHLFYHAGMIFSRSGSFAEGQAYIRKAYELNPLFEKFHAHR